MRSLTRTAYGIAAVFFAAVELGLGLSALLHPVPLLTRQCQPGSRGHVCIVQRPPATEHLGANLIAVPSAMAIPELVTLDDQVWLQATNLPKNVSVTVTLTAPDGTSCVIGQNQVTRSAGLTQVFTIPGDCTRAEGVWTATFNDGTSDIATARFLAVQPTRIQEAP